MCKEKELTEAAYRYYVDEACIEDIAKQLHRSYNYTRLIIKNIGVRSEMRLSCIGWSRKRSCRQLLTNISMGR